MPLFSLRNLVILTLLLLAVSVYIPGLDGPYLFDDHPNLLDNRYLRIDSLDLDSLRQAAFSMGAGPLRRPVAMASFAINAYLAEGFGSPISFRLTNIVIHLLNGLLVYWFLHLVIERYRKISTGSARAVAVRLKSSIHPLAAVLAFLWLVHPINLTSVLYIVQRMTSLAALFTLMALISYLIGRLRIQEGKPYGHRMIAGGLTLFGTLAVLSKETALLLPIFVLILEYTLFRKESPWQRWHALSARSKGLVAGIVAVLIITILFLAVQYAIPTYTGRNFTMLQRVLTESRVLVLYVSLLVFPRLDGFGMFHDDITLSLSLLDPPTTGLAVLLLIGMGVMAVMLRRRAPLVTLGIVWFFAGHLLESTIFSLEIAHEHRNYIPSLGLPLVLAGLVHERSIKLRFKAWIAIITAFSICFAVLTYLRASQWSSEEILYATEVRHHPDSSRANASLGRTLINQGRASEGIEALRRAAMLDAREPGTLINLTAFNATRNIASSQADLADIDRRLTEYPTSATTERALIAAADCVIISCGAAAPHLERWLRILINKDLTPIEDKSYLQYFLGRALIAQGRLNDAIDAYRTAYELDPNYLFPLFDIAQIYISAGRLEYAEVIASEIRRANQRLSLSHNKELSNLDRTLNEAKHRVK